MYEQQLIKFLVSKGCGLADAEDIVQDTQVAVIQANPQQQCFKYYQRIAYNRLINFHRKHRPILTDTLDTFPADIQEKDDRLDRLKECFGQLPRVGQEALYAHYWIGMSRPQAAAHFGITQDGWKNRLQRAKSQLKKLMETET